MTEIGADGARARKFDAPISARPQGGAGRAFAQGLGGSLPMLAAATVVALAFAVGLAVLFSSPAGGFRFFLICLIATGLMASFTWLTARRWRTGADNLGAGLTSANLSDGDLAASGGGRLATQNAARRNRPLFGNPFDMFAARFFKNTSKNTPNNTPSADGASSAAHRSDLTDALATEESKLTEALDLYAQSISSRLNFASVSLAREFRDGGEQLNAHMAATAEAAAANIARHGEAASDTLRRTVDAIDQRLAEHTRQIALQLESASVGAIGSQWDAVTRRVEHSATAMDEAGHALNERATSAVAAVETKLQQAAVVIDQMLERALQRIESRIEGQVEREAMRPRRDAGSTMGFPP